MNSRKILGILVVTIMALAMIVTSYAPTATPASPAEQSYWPEGRRPNVEPGYPSPHKPDHMGDQACRR